MNPTGQPSWRTFTALSTLLAFGISSSAGGFTQQQTPVPPEARVRIEHDPLTCVTTVVAPLIEAKMMPGQELSKSYVYFRKQGTQALYYVLMKGTPPEQAATLPRPLPETKNIDYYVQASDKIAHTRKTQNYLPEVLPVSSCSAKGVPVGPKGAGLTIGLTEAGQPPIPEGFNKDDIAKVILITGAIVTLAVALQSTGAGAAAGAGAAGGTAGSSSGAAGAGAGGGAAGGGGISTGVIVGGVAVAAGVGIGIGVSGNKATPTPRVVVNLFVEADATWSGSGDVTMQLLDPKGQSVGQAFPAGCDANGASNLL